MPIPPTFDSFTVARRQAPARTALCASLALVTLSSAAIGIAVAPATAAISRRVAVGCSTSSIPSGSISSSTATA